MNSFQTNKVVFVTVQKQLKSEFVVAMVRFRMSLCPDPAWSSFVQEKWWLLKSEASKWTQSYLSHDTESRILSVPVNCAVWPRGAFWWSIMFLITLMNMVVFPTILLFKYTLIFKIYFLRFIWTVFVMITCIFRNHRCVSRSYAAVTSDLVLILHKYQL